MSSCITWIRIRNYLKWISGEGLLHHWCNNYGFEVRDGSMRKEEVSGECFLHHWCSERCCITMECGRKRLASECFLHRWCNTPWIQSKRCCIMVECGRGEVSERMFVASLMQHTRISRLEMFLERCCITVECGRKRLAASIRCIVDAVRDVASQWNVEGRG